MKRPLIITVLLSLTVVAGCASQAPNTDSTSLGVADPYESFNRKMFKLNSVSDKYVLRPVAKGYKTVVPGIMRRGIGNFFDNLTTPRSAINNVLQGKPGRGLNELGRFVVNSTVGIGGLFDVAAAGGMERYEEDFSQTLAVWGVSEGNYLVIPFFGPRTMLSTASIPVDGYTDLQFHINDTGTRDKLNVLDIIDGRARLLSTDELLNKSADPYIALREAYLQNREFNIYDGDPPVPDDFYDFDEFDEEDAAYDETE
ncbi:MAG: VacJ family lipoprotein [Pseudomonadota bacterium]